MKTLTVLILFLLVGIGANAQLAHSSDSELNNTESATADVLLNLPMLGNITISNASYKFQQATMAFQVENLNEIIDSVAYVEIDSLLKTEEIKGEETAEENPLELKSEE